MTEQKVLQFFRKDSIKMRFLCLLVTAVFGVGCHAISQPVYPNQYVSAQVVPATAYKQPSPQRYLPRSQPTIQPVYETRDRDGLQNYATQPLVHQPIQQLYGGQRQIQRQQPQTQGAYYFQPSVQSSILSAQAREAFAAAQRKQSANREVPVPLPTQQTQYLKEVPQPAQTQQYVREQPLQFAPRPAIQQYRVQPQQQQQQQEREQQEEEEENDTNPNYQFGFDVNDDQFTNYQNRKEQRDGNKITGSYSVVDSDGYIRTVQYTADPKEGFKAEVTRQPTDIVVKVPKPDPQYQNLPQRRQPQPQYIQEAPVQRVQQRPQGNVQYQYQ